MKKESKILPACLTLLIAAALLASFAFLRSDAKDDSVPPTPVPVVTPAPVVVRQETVAPSPLAGKKIVLDPGHGGTDPGATREDVEESQLTLGITLKLKKLLESQGARVILTRADDSDVELEERCALSNAHKPSIFVSIHINSCNNDKADGIETYYYTTGSERLARCLFDHLVARLGARANWVHQRSLYVCRYTDAPSTLVEVGYISNTVKRGKLATDQYQQLVAEALANGIDSYFALHAERQVNAAGTKGALSKKKG